MPVATPSANIGGSVATGIVKRDKHAVMNTTMKRWIDITFGLKDRKSVV